MGEDGPIEDILNLSRDALQSEYPIFRTSLESENYGDLPSPFGTPPSKYLGIDPLPCAPDESLGKKDVSDPLVFPEGSPVTPQMQESCTFLSEIEFENQEHPSRFESRLLPDQHNQENHGQERNFAVAKGQARTNQQHTGQFRHRMDTDFQELLELGKAMNLPSVPELGTSTFCPVESESAQEKESETVENIALLPFPLDEIFKPLTKETLTEEQSCANTNIFSLMPNVKKPLLDSSAAGDTEIGTNYESLASKEQCDPNPTNIDKILLEVASKNCRRWKRDIVLADTQCDDDSAEHMKKRRTTFSTGDSDGEGDEPCRSSRSTGERKKKPSKRGQGYCRVGAEKSGKAQTSPGSTPSRFCHICTRAAKPDVVLVCGNVARGTCRKVICFKCIRDMTWDWGSLRGDDVWTCTHCREDCPAKAQCHTYRRVNQNRRADGRRSRKTANVTSSAKLLENSDHKSN